MQLCGSYTANGQKKREVLQGREQNRASVKKKGEGGGLGCGRNRWSMVLIVFLLARLLLQLITI